MSYHWSWGRGVWIQDLGTLKHKSAYDHLREVWLHDLNGAISKVALEALAKLEDERTLDDLELKLKDVNPFEYRKMNMYLDALSNFKSDRAVDLIMDVAYMLSSLYMGKRLEGNDVIDDMYNLSPVSDKLRGVMFNLDIVGTVKARKALFEIARWFPLDAMIVGAYKDLRHYQSLRDKRKPELKTPEGHGEKLVGIDDGYIPF